MDVRAGRILGRKLHAVGILACELDRLHRACDQLIASHVELMLQMNVRGRDKDMDSWALRGLDRFRTGFDITFDAARQSADLRRVGLSADGLGDILNRFQIALRRYRE